MKYKVGDKVKIKTWEAMKKEYGEIYDDSGTIRWKEYRYSCGFTYSMEKPLNEICSNRILTIRIIYDNDCYGVKEIGYSWTDQMIECLAEKPTPIETRFEILDL